MTETQQQQQQGEHQEPAMAPPVGAEVDVTIVGGRARRSTQKFGFDAGKNDEEEEEFKPPVGPGVKLRDMEAVAEQISHMGKKDAETIKSLYSIMYGRRFQQKNIRTIKDHILDFTGIPDADDKTRQQLMGKIGKWMRKYLQDVMDLLGVDRSKKSFDEENKPHDKDALINRLIDWLCNPQESQNTKQKSATPATKKKSATKKGAASTKTATSAKRKTAAETKKPAKKAKTASKKSAPVEEDDEEDATESEVDNASDDDDSDFGEDNGAKSKKSTKRASKKAAPRRGNKGAAAVESEEDNDPAESSVGDEEPVATLEEDVQNKVKEIISKGDAEQLTVKKIVRQLSEDMGKDFSSKKSAIKDFVTNLHM